MRDLLLLNELFFLYFFAIMFKVICTEGTSQLEFSGKMKKNSRFLNRKPPVLILSLWILIHILFTPLFADSKQCVWKDIDKIVAIGDVHGDYDNFVKILKSADLVDDRLRWSGGACHLVQTGDIMDRGDYAKDIMNLLKRLQKEATEAGGRVHILLGNHEEMNITGIVFRHPEYVSPKQFASFLPDSFRIKMEDDFRSQLRTHSETGTNSDVSFLDSYYETKWRGLVTDENIQKMYVNTFNTDYGKWLIEQNVVIKINDVVFSHGGISEKYSNWPLQKINDVMREELNVYRLAYKRGTIPQIKREILYMPDSPLWNRDFALKDERTFTKVVNKILKNLDANYMVVAHTPPGSPVIPENQKDEVVFRTRFNQKIWMIDTGIAEYYYGILSFLVYENGEFFMTEWRDEEYEADLPFEPSPIKLKELSREEMEYFLYSAAVVNVIKGSVPGRTASWRIDLDDGEIKGRAMFKVVDDTRPTALPDSYKYELAAYALDKLLGFNRIPPMIKREIENTWGSLQIRIENCFGLSEKNEKVPPDPQAFSDTLEEINVFENLIYNERTDLDDILIHKETWEVFRVDFSEAFSPTPELIPEQKIKRCSKELFRNLQELSDNVIKARLEEYLNEDEISALLRRKALIIETIENLIKEKGRKAVLF